MRDCREYLLGGLVSTVAVRVPALSQLSVGFGDRFGVRTGGQAEDFVWIAAATAGHYLKALRHGEREQRDREAGNRGAEA